MNQPLEIKVKVRKRDRIFTSSRSRWKKLVIALLFSAFFALLVFLLFSSVDGVTQMVDSIP